jgi:alpha-L-rhamnosidase
LDHTGDQGWITVAIGLQSKPTDVKVEGIPDIKPADFTALALYSDIPKAGSLETGHDLVNKLIANTMWGQKGNFLDAPTDCPQRDERLGWTGDAQVFSRAAMYLTDCYAFFRKYLYDMGTEQKSLNGLVPIFIPSFGNHICAAVWGDAVCIILWNLYVFYGDKRILVDNFDNMKAWVDYLRQIDGCDHQWGKQFHFGGDCKQFQFGDWLALDYPDRRDDQVQGGTDVGFIACVFYMNSARLTAKAARVLGKTGDAERYEKLAQSVLRWIRTEYFSETGRCCIDTQTAHMLTLQFGLWNDPSRARDALKTSLSRVGNKLQTGFVGTPMLCNALSENGMNGLAYHLLLNEDYPGWFHEIKLGATTVWERWNSVNADGSISSTGMNSLNHYAYGSIVEWLWRYVAGINPDLPGFRKVIIKPVPHWDLKYANVGYRSPAGTYKVYWRVIDETHFSLSVTVPFGCEARLELPFVSTEKNTALTSGEFNAVYETSGSIKDMHNLAGDLFGEMNDGGNRNG